MIKCQATDYAFYRGRNISVDEKFSLHPEDLEKGKDGAVMTPRWCIALEPFEVAKETPKKEEAKTPDIFSAV